MERMNSPEMGFVIDFEGFSLRYKFKLFIRERRFLADFALRLFPGIISFPVATDSSPVAGIRAYVRTAPGEQNGSVILEKGGNHVDSFDGK